MTKNRQWYQEYAPAPALGDYVSCFWSAAAAAASEHVVLPDGCIDIIFDLSCKQFSQGKIVGTMTRPLLFQATGAVEMVAVRFLPGGAVPFLPFAANDITDLQCEVTTDWRDERLAERIRNEPSWPRRIKLLEGSLLRRLSSVPAVDRRIPVAVSMSRRLQGTTEAIAKELDMGRQQLTRLFRHHVGVGPKVYSRVARMQKLVESIKTSAQHDWASLALQLGYYDQSHMINECRSLTGRLPTQLARG